MSSNSKKILKKLAEKPAVPVEMIIQDPLAPTLGRSTPPSQGERKNKYAISRTLKNLVDAGYAQIHSSDNQNYVRITPKGKNKLNSMEILGEGSLVPLNWDGFWRIIIIDIPEERKNEREALRYLLKKANFVCIKNTVWVSPHQYEHLFMNIKKDLGLTTELMILVTDKLDPETQKAFLNAVKE